MITAEVHVGLIGILGFVDFLACAVRKVYSDRLKGNV